MKKSLTESNSLKVLAVAPTGPVTTAVGASSNLLKIQHIDILKQI